MLVLLALLLLLPQFRISRGTQFCNSHRSNTRPHVAEVKVVSLIVGTKNLAPGVSSANLAGEQHVSAG